VSDDDRRLHRRLQDCERERQAAEDDNLRKAKRIADLQAEVRRLEETIASLYQSSSWRWSAPLRLPRATVLTVRAWRLWLDEQIERADGAKALLAQAASALRAQPRGALAGAWRRWRTNGRFRPTPDSWPHDRYDYPAWLRRYGEPSRGAAESVSAPVARVGTGPLLSVLMPVYNPPVELLAEAIDSVCRQGFGDWELCIADDASTDPAVRALLERRRDAEPRIRVVFRPVNGHISAATNSALALASGDYLVLLDQDDLLADSALASVAEAIRANPDAILLYSDEDRIDAAGAQRSEPYFKPTFNYELLLAQNMISHLGIYRRAEVEAVGGLREGLEGSQDHDLALRVIERAAPGQIVHIPQVLYHWRAIAGSTALDVGEKGYAFRAGARAIQEHLRRSGQSGTVEACRDMAIFHSVRYPLPEQATVDVLLGPGAACDGHPLEATRQAITAALSELKPCFQQLASAAGMHPGAGFTQRLQAHIAATRERVLRQVDGDDPAAVRRALRQQFLLIVDLPLASATPGWLECLVGWAAQDRVGFVGPRVWSALERMDYGGVVFSTPDCASHAHQGWPIGTDGFRMYGYGARAVLHQRFAALAPQLLLCRLDLPEVLGGLDCGYHGWMSLLDLEVRAHAAGCHNVWVPEASVRLPPGAPRGRWNLFADRRVPGDDLARWRSRQAAVPLRWAYHPQLAEAGDFSLAWPPRGVDGRKT
jgi:O-antigen biosynthesis protein